ncbi:hypothetical protein JTB14_002485 [Gonioctena quinquepunctata]|nr:hypothetical protein JTB14_002485 [Gonioctena quinquepunctata]
MTTRIDADENSQKLNVWAGIFEERLIGPIFLDGNLTGETYLELLNEFVYPQLVDIIETDDRYHEDHLIFQQDGAHLHIMHSLLGRFWIECFLEVGLEEEAL